VAGTKRSWIDRLTAAGIRGTSEAVFPSGFDAPDWQDARMEERTLRYIHELPPANAALIRFMFISIEFVLFLLMPSFLPFSRNSIARRQKVLYRWKKSSLYPIRMVADGLKATLHMVYLSHPDVSAYIGEYKHKKHKQDDYPMPVRRPPARIKSAGTKAAPRSPKK
jgi:hypothetical protein